MNKQPTGRIRTRERADMNSIIFVRIVVKVLQISLDNQCIDIDGRKCPECYACAMSEVENS